MYELKKPLLDTDINQVFADLQKTLNSIASNNEKAEKILDSMDRLGSASFNGGELQQIFNKTEQEEHA
eukprot:CAMPEP_0168318130 /NCGR_PEP_ID=MMETSP0213-20121227/294_1 /TAXON_ID=151035 /ORGANISM="Euplotes harpa, Strain FSP1.4" /LENGTH=67 /DNA_ID=CAMNT_0008319135 /DNA_START=68 /DNA_END=271 /DNA_ORIENTATION=-